MWKMLPQAFKSASALLILLTLLCGVAYPLLVTGVGQLCFPDRANGSLVIFQGRPVGSKLIGQPFRSSGYFWSRPSDTPEYPYNPEDSDASNLGPSNPLLREHVEHRIARWIQGGVSAPGPIPIDLVTSSASGLDPDISPAAALYQVARISRIRGLPPRVLTELVRRHIQGRVFGLLGAPRVNVLMLNIALERMLLERRRTRARALPKG